MGNYGGKPIEDQIIDLKFASKSFERDAARCEKEAAKARIKVKKALAKGQNDFAQIHAENVIREQKQSIHCLKMAAKLDVTASRLKSAALQDQFMKSFATVSSKIQDALRLQAVGSLSAALDQLEAQTGIFESSKVAIPEASINNDVQKLMEEISLESEILTLPDVPKSTAETIAEPEKDHLQQRLDNLLQ